MNHAFHIAAVTQLRHTHSPGRAFYDRKLDGRPHTKISDPRPETTDQQHVYRHLVADAQRHDQRDETGPGGQPGTTLELQRGRLNPEHRHFGEATPEPDPNARPRNPRPSTGQDQARPSRTTTDSALTNKEEIARARRSLLRPRSPGASASGHDACVMRP